MSAPQTLEELREELHSLEQRISALQEMVLRRNRIANLIRNWETIYSIPSEPKVVSPKTSTPAKTSKTRNPGDRSQTAAYAERSITAVGPLQPDDLINAMRNLGWPCSEDNAVDRKRVYVALKRKANKFQREKNGAWNLVTTPSKAAHGD
jgi:hypothetical protein